MSHFVNDQAIVDEGRDNKYTDVAVDLRDQIVKKLYDKLVEQDIGSKVTKAWYKESANNAEMLERQKVYLDQLDVHQPASSDEPFGGTSNLHLPMPYIVSKAYVARFMQAIWNIDPPFSCKPRRPDSADYAPVVEEFMQYALKSWVNHYEGAEEAVENWVTRWVNSGTGIMKQRWQKEFCRFQDVETVAKEGVPRAVVMPDGSTQLQPQVTYEDVEVTRTLEKFNGPLMEAINLEDFVMIGGCGNPERADMIIHRYWLTASELWSGVDQKLFDKEAVEKIIAAGDNPTSGSINSGIKIQRAFNAGKSDIDTDVDMDRYEILESYLKVDVDGSGITSDIIVWSHTLTNEILRATYLYRVSQTGERPFSVIHFSKRDDQDYGVGLPEILHPLSVELDAMHNIKIDFGMHTALPVGFIRSSSSLDPTSIQLEPGALIPVEDPQRDVYFPQRPSSAGFFGNEEQVIQSYIERLTGLSDINYGSQASQGAARTASGVRALMGESNTNLDIHLRRLNRGWKKILRHLFHTLRQRVDSRMVFRVTGSDGATYFRQLSGYELAYDYDIEVSNNSIHSNKAVQIETAQTLMSITSNPLYLQIGICSPGNVYESLKMYMQSLGIKDVHRFISKPQGHVYVPEPEEVFNRVIRGMEVNPMPQMDIDGIIAFFTTMIDQQSEAATLSQDELTAAINGLRSFQQFAEALAAQQAQVQVAQQMRSNAAQSQQQAPVAMNPLEGTMGGAMPTTQV